MRSATEIAARKSSAPSDDWRTQATVAGTRRSVCAAAIATTGAVRQSCEWTTSGHPPVTHRQREGGAAQYLVAVAALDQEQVAAPAREHTVVHHELFAVDLERAEPARETEPLRIGFVAPGRRNGDIEIPGERRRESRGRFAELAVSRHRRYLGRHDENAGLGQRRRAGRKSWSAARQVE